MAAAKDIRGQGKTRKTVAKARVMLYLPPKVKRKVAEIALRKKCKQHDIYLKALRDYLKKRGIVDCSEAKALMKCGAGHVRVWTTRSSSPRSLWHRRLVPFESEGRAFCRKTDAARARWYFPKRADSQWPTHG